MAAVLGIVRGHQGSITVYSEPGQGSTFKVIFPVSNKTPAAETIGGDAAKLTGWKGCGTILVGIE